jgi:hypothetical protein
MQALYSLVLIVGHLGVIEYFGPSPKFYRPGPWLAAMPIHPRKLVRAAMAVVLVPTLAAYFLGIYGPWVKDLTSNLRVTADQAWNALSWKDPALCATLNVRPPLEFWQPVNGAAPTIRAPWGETFQPPISRVLGVNVYNPFAVGCGNTKRFFDWQFERATVAVYGQTLAFDPKVTWMPPAAPQARRQIVTAAGFAAEVILIGIFLVAGNWWRLRRFPRRIVKGLSLSLSLFVVTDRLLFILLTDGITGYSNDPLQRIVWALPDSLAAVVAIAAIVLAFLYWVFDRLSRRMEFVGGPSMTVPDV